MLCKNKIFIFVVFSFSLIIGLIFDENAGGGAKIDQEYLLKYIFKLSDNLNDGLNYFFSDFGTLIHSPVFYIIISFILKISNSFLLTNILYIFLSCSLPLIFYLILKSKNNTNYNFLFAFSLIIFFSPYFRSSAIWLLGDNLSLIFFSLSILFFIKTKNNSQKKENYFLCLFFLILCCYVRYYFAIFSIYYLIYFYKNLDKLLFLKLIIFCLLLALPAFIYLYYIIDNYEFLKKLNSYGTFNYSTNGFIICSIIFFYFIPFVILQINEIITYYKQNFNYLLYILILIITFYFLQDFFIQTFYEFSFGGGIFIKLSNLLNIETKLFICLINFFSFLVINFYFKDEKLNNYLILFILILSFPLNIIFQKYFDPLFIIILFGLINSKNLSNILIRKIKNLVIIYSFFISYFIFSIVYYL